MKFEVAPRAVSEAERCGRWWRENRPAAPTLFETELLDARKFSGSGLAARPHSSCPTHEASLQACSGVLYGPMVQLFIQAGLGFVTSQYQPGPEPKSEHP